MTSTIQIVFGYINILKLNYHTNKLFSLYVTHPINGMIAIFVQFTITFILWLFDKND